MADAPTCAACNKPAESPAQPLKRCARCHTTPYCGRDCQKADWKNHKKVCATQANDNPSQPSSSSQPGSSPRGNMEALFGGKASAQLAKHTEEKAMTILIDSYRMRVEDELNFRGNEAKDSIYDGGDPVKGFRRYLVKAESVSGLLPRWWNEHKREACVALGARKDHWYRLDRAVEKSDIQEHYGDGAMPMHLRMLAEEIVGSYVARPGVGLSDF